MMFISRKATIVASLVLGMMVTTGVLAAPNDITIDGSFADWDDELCRNDLFQDGNQGGVTGAGDVYDDETNQNDVDFLCVASNRNSVSPADTLYFRWHWDDTDFSGANTGDGCIHVDTDLDGVGDFAFCGTVATDAGNNTTVDSKLYACNPQTSTATACKIGGNGFGAVTYNGTCGFSTNEPDRFAAEASRTAASCNGTDCTTLDMAVECSLPLNDIGVAPGATIAGILCTHPSAQPGSNANECTLNPAGQRLTVNTDTGVNSPTTPTAITLQNLTGFGSVSTPPWLLVSVFFFLLVTSKHVLSRLQWRAVAE